MFITSLILFFLDTFLVFFKHFCDGIVAKHFLAFSAIAAALVVRNPENLVAFCMAVSLFASGILYWAWKNQAKIRAYIHQ